MSGSYTFNSRPVNSGFRFSSLRYNLNLKRTLKRTYNSRQAIKPGEAVRARRWSRKTNNSSGAAGAGSLAVYYKARQFSASLAAIATAITHKAGRPASPIYTKPDFHTLFRTLLSDALPLSRLITGTPCLMLTHASIRIFACTYTGAIISSPQHSTQTHFIGLS